METSLNGDQFNETLKLFFDSYKALLDKSDYDAAEQEALLSTFSELIKEQLSSPFIFGPYHQGIRSPFDYYNFGLNFLRPLLNKKKSKILGFDNLLTIQKQLAKGENVILLANHQTEPDPIFIGLLLEDQFPDFASNLIYVAGHRVTTDPLAIPFSMGCNLLSVYSKKHIEHPAEEKANKQQHNKRTLAKMQELLAKGGCCIYVAPSGGRDRRNEKGAIEVAPFDRQSVEMFHLIAKQAKTTTHFYPMALFTYNLLPPPETVGGALGEPRLVQHGPAHIAFCDEIDLNKFQNNTTLSKQELRQKKTDTLFASLLQAYQQLV